MPYRAEEYWTDRLSRDCSLRGVGHASYSRRYNAWIYRTKGRVLSDLLSGVPFAEALDIGSGTGWVTEQLARRGAAVTGIDVAEPAVEYLRHQFPDETFVRLTVGDQLLPFSDDTFDLVTMMDVAYHITNDEKWANALTEIARVLRPGGIFVATDSFGAADDSQSEHVRFRALRTWEAFGDRLGLELDRVVPLYRWLSRPRKASALFWMPSALRGPVEYVLERTVPRAPHLRCARFSRRPVRL
jgi:SAM-dependent methyltransferase